MTSVAVVIVAAGSGTRLGAGVPKAFAPLGDATVLEHAVARAADAAVAPQLVVVVPTERVDSTAQLLGARTTTAPNASPRLTVVAGGAERADSVVAGLSVIDDAVDVVLVHDAARALTPPALFDAVARAVAERGTGVLPVAPIADTVKRVDRDGIVVETVDRSVLAAAQTPQGFPRAELVAAYELAADARALHTDDAAVFAAAGRTVTTIEGSALAFKVTTPSDLERAEGLVGERVRRSEVVAGAGQLRTGIGVDAHAFRAGTPLWLGGVLWPDAEAGLAGYSDGDAAAHAIVDALLTAAGLGDIGSRFGTADPEYAGASGARFIAEAVALVEASGWRVVNAAVEIVANTPKLGPRRSEMQEALSAALGADVSVAATTSDGLGLTGEGRGIAAIATALIARAD